MLNVQGLDFITIQTQLLQETFVIEILERKITVIPIVKFVRFLYPTEITVYIM